MGITRFPAQKSERKDLRRNGQAQAITAGAACVLVYAHNAFASPVACVYGPWAQWPKPGHHG
ncbi:alpha-galactosidase [Lacticaseibacillus rhamnosus]|uniref:Uncharacterized protein n=1 Tax=Lacticaseibacillus rhamnosus (strain ATCC 53103 / LMG 18243 / GG) TaxID=568703 RepID=A0A809MW47_LACRG|nr:alpha-galactosidase [Lacticaseibacillus rhamnosus]BAI41365.1 hypothetical protein LRHM_0838 [Lacticaseibacillus rhamnosus GG]CAR86776.1 Conserved protein [Lacticaseibacillus rhamnosus GG]